MSTEHQQYSIRNQSTAIALYAAAHSMVIARSFVDAGKSGLHIEGRPGLQDLIASVQSGNADFECVLVYDVSRWGRFQDADEAAHYEFICKQAGIEIIYCAERFRHENATINNLLKALKRTMAGEYSRELSAKVFAGQARIASLGFHAGGRPAYGFRRLLLDQDGNSKQILQRDERKSLQSDRVVLIYGPNEEIRTIKKIFDLFTKQKKTRFAIAGLLNRRGIRPPDGRQWGRSTITKLLSNPSYAGTHVWGRSNRKLGTRQKPAPENEWVIKKAAVQPIITAKQFADAQALLAPKGVRFTVPKGPRFTEQELLDNFRQIIRKHGKLTARLIADGSKGMSIWDYQQAFGSLRNAYRAVGYKGGRDQNSSCDFRALIKKHRNSFLASIEQQCRHIGAELEVEDRPPRISINGQLRVVPMIVPFYSWPSRRIQSGWCFNLFFNPGDDILAFARLDQENATIRNYYFIPAIAGFSGRFWVPEGQELGFLEVYRSRSLVPLLKTVMACELIA